MAVNTYIPLDILKPNDTLIDLTPNFNGRVGDSNSFIRLQFKKGGLPLDLTNDTVYFSGKDSNGVPCKIYGTAKADQTFDNLQVGRVTFYFPSGTFKAEGLWDIDNTFFGISDETGTEISSVNVKLNVLSNSVEMGIDDKPFFTDLETIKQKMLDWVVDTKNTIQTVLDDANSGTLNTTMAALKTQLEAYQEAIKDAKLVVTSDFDDFKDSVSTQFQQVISDIATNNIVANRDNASTPQDYSDDYLGKNVYELVSAGALFGSNLKYGLGTATYGFLNTQVVPYTDNAKVPGSVIQTYRVSINDHVLTFSRGNKDATTWDSFTNKGYASTFSSTGITYSNGASANADTPLKYATIENENLYSLMLTGAINCPAAKNGSKTAVATLPTGISSTGDALRLGKFTAYNQYQVQVSNDGTISLIANQDNQASTVYIDFQATWTW